MNDERKRILEMVSDGTITPSEGARLLEALGSSGFGRERPATPRRKSIIDASAMLSEIGPMIQETMGDIFKGTRKTDPLDGMEFQETENYSEKLPEGNDIVIHGSMKKGKPISILLIRSSDNLLKASVEGGESVSYCEKNGKTILQWKSGDLTVMVPDIAGSVQVVSKGGSIQSKGVRVPLTLNTMGGGVSILNPGSSFSAKTMGGQLDIALDSSWDQNSKAKSMGGGVNISVAGEIPVIIDASTLGGTIDPGDSKHEIVSSSGGKRGGSRMCISYGDSDNAPKLSVSTMGGDIVVKGES